MPERSLPREDLSLEASEEVVEKAPEPFTEEVPRVRDYEDGAYTEVNTKKGCP